MFVFHSLCELTFTSTLFHVHTHTHALTHSLIHAEQKTLKPFINRVCWCSCRGNDRCLICFSRNYVSRDEWQWCTILIYIISFSTWRLIVQVDPRGSLSFLVGLCGPLLLSPLIFLFILVEKYKCEKTKIVWITTIKNCKFTCKNS